jgi:DNA-directed RNA polymerase sigma subunit (sigma70/sigma32)
MCAEDGLVDDWLQQYSSAIDEQPVCEDSWFQEQCRNLHAGDEQAGRRISGSCLRFALKIAQRRAAEFPECHLLDVVEEANAGLMDAVLTFKGSSRDEFLQHAETRIHERLNAMA